MSVSPYSAGLRCRCPRCGDGCLFEGLLTVRECCANCGLDLRANDSGDGPAVFVILIPGAIGMLRPLKATLVALQYRHRDL